MVSKSTLSWHIILSPLTLRFKLEIALWIITERIEKSSLKFKSSLVWVVLFSHRALLPSLGSMMRELRYHLRHLWRVRIRLLPLFSSSNVDRQEKNPNTIQADDANNLTPKLTFWYESCVPFEKVPIGISDNFFLTCQEVRILPSRGFFPVGLGWSSH